MGYCGCLCGQIFIDFFGKMHVGFFSRLFSVFLIQWFKNYLLICDICLPDGNCPCFKISSAHIVSCFLQSNNLLVCTAVKFKKLPIGRSEINVIGREILEKNSLRVSCFNGESNFFQSQSVVPQNFWFYSGKP